MSLKFNGTGGVSHSDVNGAVAYGIGLSCWFFPLDVATQQNLIHVNSGPNTYQLVLAGNTAGDPCAAWTWNGTSTVAATTTNGVTANRWNYVSVGFGSNTSRAVILNNGTVVTDSADSTQTSTVIDRFVIGGTASVRPFTGYIAHVWLHQVGGNNAVSSLHTLTAGGVPLMNVPNVRRSLGAAYFPLTEPGRQVNVLNNGKYTPPLRLPDGVSYSNWNPPVQRFMPREASKIYFLPSSATNKLRSQIAFLKPYTGILPVANG